MVLLRMLSANGNYFKAFSFLKAKIFCFIFIYILHLVFTYVLLLCFGVYPVSSPSSHIRCKARKGLICK